MIAFWIGCGAFAVWGHHSRRRHFTEYLAKMRITIQVTGHLTPEDLTSAQRDEFMALYRQWRSEPD